MPEQKLQIDKSGEQEIIKKLHEYGHLEMPFGEKREINVPLKSLTLADQVVNDAVQSYQSYHAGVMEPIIAGHYPDRLSASVRVDGVVGPATLELFKTERCAVPDYDFSLPEELVGSGNWKRCYDIGEFHAVKVKFLNSPPAFIADVFDEIWGRVVDAYSEIGLMILRDDNANANIDMSFVQPDGGWIGLAILGQRQTCADRIWAKFDKNYKPKNLISEWTTLIKHELGHNCGLSHSSGGVMNPYIVAGLPVSWKNDPVFNLLRSNFGGEPVPRKPKERKMVLAWEYSDGKYETIQEVPSSGGNVWP